MATKFDLDKYLVDCFRNPKLRALKKVFVAYSASEAKVFFYEEAASSYAKSNGAGWKVKACDSVNYAEGEEAHYNARPKEVNKDTNKEEK